MELNSTFFEFFEITIENLRNYRFLIVSNSNDFPGKSYLDLSNLLNRDFLVDELEERMDSLFKDHFRAKRKFTQHFRNLKLAQEKREERKFELEILFETLNKKISSFGVLTLKENLTEAVCSSVALNIISETSNLVSSFATGTK
jgi:hypothetical protein